MGTGKPLPELFQQTQKTLGKEVFSQFANGLGTPHGSMTHHMRCAFPVQSAR